MVVLSWTVGLLLHRSRLVALAPADDASVTPLLVRSDLSACVHVLPAGGGAGQGPPEADGLVDRLVEVVGQMSVKVPHREARSHDCDDPSCTQGETQLQVEPISKPSSFEVRWSNQSEAPG